MSVEHVERARVSRRGVLGAGLAMAAGAALPRSARADDTPARAPSAAPMPNGAGYYRFKVGELDVMSLSDGGAAMPPYPAWGENASEAQVAEALLADFLDPASAAMTFNVPLVRTATGVVLFDAGNGAGGRAWGAGKLARHLENAGVAATDVVAVVVTHLHGDHFGGLSEEDGTMVFPNARYFIQKAEAEFWSGPNPDLSGTKLDDESKKRFIAGAASAFGRIKGRAEIIDGEKEVVPGVRVEPAPGHTAGHQIAHLSSGDKQLLLFADCVHHHTLSLRHPGWHIRFDSDAVKGAETRKRMLDRAAADRALVLAYHMPFPGVGHVRREGEGFEWVPAEWKW